MPHVVSPSLPDHASQTPPRLRDGERPAEAAGAGPTAAGSLPEISLRRAAVDADTGALPHARSCPGNAAAPVAPRTKSLAGPARCLTKPPAPPPPPAERATVAVPPRGMTAPASPRPGPGAAQTARALPPAESSCAGPAVAPEGPQRYTGPQLRRGPSGWTHHAAPPRAGPTGTLAPGRNLPSPNMAEASGPTPTSPPPPPRCASSAPAPTPTLPGRARAASRSTYGGRRRQRSMTAGTTRPCWTSPSSLNFPASHRGSNYGWTPARQ